MQPADVLRLLPEVYRQAVTPGSPMAALVAVMHDLQTPAEAVLTELDGYFDPYRAPSPMLPLLARWLDLDRILVQNDGRADARQDIAPLPVDLPRLRDLVAHAALLSQWRGTARGLTLFLELATGSRGFAIDEHVLDDSGRPVAFHVRVRIPAEAHAQQALIVLIVESEKPAYVTYEIVAQSADETAAPADDAPTPTADAESTTEE